MNFVAEQNIKRFQQLLEHETDPKKRTVLEELLANEQAKLAPGRDASNGCESAD